MSEVETTVEYRGFHQAAAVLESFAPESLLPFGEPPADRMVAILDLLNDCIVAEGASPGRWTLRFDARRDALRELGTRPRLIAALRTNPLETQNGPVQRAIVTLLMGQPIASIESSSTDELSALLQAMSWFEGILEPSVAKADVERALQYHYFVRPFKFLTENFEGRAEQLDALRRYVDATPSRNLVEGALRGWDRLVAHFKSHPPLMLYGVGGMGKSTIVARFLLEHLEARSKDCFPIAYLDFERPSLMPAAPETLLAEVLRQLGVQFPVFEARSNAMIAHLHRGRRQSQATLAEAQSLRSIPALLSETEEDVLGGVLNLLAGSPLTSKDLSETDVASLFVAVRNELSAEERSALCDRGQWLFDPDICFDEEDIEDRPADESIHLTEKLLRRLRREKRTAEILTELSAVASQSPIVSSIGQRLKPTLVGQKKFLLVLDTFEKVQFQTDESVDQLFSLLTRLQQVGLTGLKLVLAGRVPIDGVQAISVGELTLDDATHYFEAQGLQSKTARALAGAIDRSPLTLRLAAMFLSRPERVERKARLRPSDLPLEELRRDGAQAYIFRRLLTNLKDEQVEKLAHPGLILRWITPEIVLSVLNGPCNLGLTTLREAQQVFDRLGRDVTLVTMDGERLIHRPETRKLMLPQIHEIAPEKARKIHGNAIEYFRARTSERDQIEAAYHSLWLDQSALIPGETWKTIGAALDDVLDELPLMGKFALASRRQIDPPGLDWTKAPLADWERHVATRASESLASNPQHALTLILERKDRTVESPLYLLEARATEVALGPVAALELIDRRLAAIEGAGASLRAQMLAYRSELLRRSGEDQASHEAAEGLEFAFREGVSVGVAAEAAGVVLSNAREDSPLASQARGYLDENFEEVARNYPESIRSAAPDLAQEDPKFVIRALERVGFGFLNWERMDYLLDALVYWDGALHSGSGAAELASYLRIDSNEKSSSPGIVFLTSFSRLADSLISLSLAAVLSNTASVVDLSTRESQTVFGAIAEVWRTSTAISWTAGINPVVWKALDTPSVVPHRPAGKSCDEFAHAAFEALRLDLIEDQESLWARLTRFPFDDPSEDRRLMVDLLASFRFERSTSRDWRRGTPSDVRWRLLKDTAIRAALERRIANDDP